MKKISIMLLVLVMLGCGQMVFSNYVPGKGDIKGMALKYVDTDSIYITAGYGECNGHYFTLASDELYNLSSLGSTEGFHYIYIDDSTSSYPSTPVFIDSTVEPEWSNSLFGWYNGYDRCIGVVWSFGNSSIVKFDTLENGNLVEYILMESNYKYLISNANPTGNWVFLEATAYTPVNAKKIKIGTYERDLDNVCNLYVSSYEGKSIGEVRAGGYAGSDYSNDYVILGASRDLAWNGQDDDDNVTFITVLGFIYSR